MADKSRSSFRFVDVTADSGLAVRAAGPESLFSCAAEGLFSGLCDRRTVRPTASRAVKARAHDAESLLVAWLNELIYIFETEKFLLSRCRIISWRPTHCRGVALGERFDPARHGLKTVFKAATFHGLKVERRGDIWLARVILDV